jgi:hypothetical protein
LFVCSKNTKSLLELPQAAKGDIPEAPLSQPSAAPTDHLDASIPGDPGARLLAIAVVQLKQYGVI